MPDNYKEHQYHEIYDKHCSTCYEEEVKCEVCGSRLARLEVYGRNLCYSCEGKLLGY